MNRPINHALLAAALLVLPLLSGCSTVKSLTGQNDDSVLPGQREDVLPPDQQTARDPIITGEQPSPNDIDSQPPAACDPNVQECSPSVDQEAGPAEGL